MKARKIIKFKINIQIRIVLTLGIQAQGYFLNIISWGLKWNFVKNILILEIFITILMLLHEIGYFRNEKS